MKQLAIFIIVALLVCPLTDRAFAFDRESVGEECYDILHHDEEPSEEDRERCIRQVFDSDSPTVIVISPLRRKEVLAKIPASVAVVTKKEIERSSADSTAELLRDVPGVQITDAGQPGLKRIRIRGSEARRGAILIDGQEFSDEREVGTPLLIAPEMIERIEVLRGTGSVLHGSRGIGGVINIITKKGGYHPIQGSLSTSYDSASEGYQTFGSLFGSEEGFSYRASGTFSEHGDRETPDGELPNTSYDNDSYSLYISKELGDSHTVAVSYDDFNASSDVFVDPMVATTLPFIDFTIDAPVRDRSKIGLFYDGENLSDTVEKIHFDGFFQDSDRVFETHSILSLDFGMGPIIRDTRINTDSTLETWGGNGQIDFNLGSSNTLIAGIETKDDSLDQIRFRDVSSSGIASPTEIVIDNASQTSIELFAENAWAFQQDWEIRGGVRGFFIDSELESTTRPGLVPNSTDDEQLVGAIGLKYEGVTDTTFWAGWSQGYVFPTLINLATGAFAGPSYVNPNPDLDPETSNTFEIGGRYLGNNFELDTTFFYTMGEDYIDHVLCSAASSTCIQPASSRDRVYVNIDDVDSFGAEMVVRLPMDSITPYANATWIRRQFQTADRETYDTGIPAISSRFGVQVERELSGNILGWLDFYVRADSESDEDEGDGEVLHKAGWASLNVALGAEIGEKEELKVVLDLQNLGDTGYVTSTENFQARGRSAIIKISGSF